MLDRERLAKGLDSILGNIVEAPASDRQERLIQIDPNVIQPNPHQPRRDFDPQGIRSLGESIKEHGLLQPIVVRPAKDGYQLVAGERRWRAAREVGLRQIPAIVREVTAKDSLGMALVENLQRHNLNPIEKARAFWELIEVFQLTQEEVGKYTGQDRSSVANTLRLLELPVEIQEHVSRGTLSPGHARALLALKDESLQKKLCQRILEEGLTVRQAEAIASGIKIQKIEKSTPKHDHHIRELEDRLRKALGTKVQIRHNKGKGKIIIHFSGDAQFEHLMQRLSA